MMMMMKKENKKDEKNYNEWRHVGKGGGRASEEKVKLFELPFHDHFKTLSKLNKQHALVIQVLFILSQGIKVHNISHDKHNNTKTLHHPARQLTKRQQHDQLSQKIPPASITRSSYHAVLRRVHNLAKVQALFIYQPIKAALAGHGPLAFSSHTGHRHWSEAGDKHLCCS